MHYIKEITDPTEIYAYMETLEFPYRYDTPYALWEKSYARDTDGEGRELFADLKTLGAYEGEKLIGFLQYGRTAFGFDETGEISDAVSCPVIRNFYYDADCGEIGKELLAAAMRKMSVGSGRIYAFFHYFGMSCYARHGKLFADFSHIHDLLLESGFCIEHENVFYSSKAESNACADSGISCLPHERTVADQQYFDFLLGTEVVGGCEVHFLAQQKISYLRWIFTDEAVRGKGIGTRCMAALRSELCRRGYTRLDTDTARLNTGAQRFYEKNGFVREGLTRSYYYDVDAKQPCKTHGS